MGEAMHGTRVPNESIVDIVGLHLGFEGGDIFGGYVGVVGAMEGEHFCLNILTVAWCG